MRLPEKNREADAAIREGLQHIGILRETGHDHFNGSPVVLTFHAGGKVFAVYGRKLLDNLGPGKTPVPAGAAPGGVKPRRRELAAELVDQGVEVLRVAFPEGMDANEYASKMTLAGDVETRGVPWVLHRYCGRRNG